MSLFRAKRLSRSRRLAQYCWERIATASSRRASKLFREFVEELFRFLIDFPGMMYLVFILTIIVAGENRDKELMLEELAVLMNIPW